MSISTVTSEALQLKLRQLLPSQQGFGTDLSASDTIIPVIDLTRAAEGSDVPEILQTALAFGSQTAFNVVNTTTVLINNTGFYRVFGTGTILGASGSIKSIEFTMTDGATVKSVYKASTAAGVSNTTANFMYDFVVFIGTGESLSATCGASNFLSGSTRQIADINGTLVQPVGFTPQ